MGDELRTAMFLGRNCGSGGGGIRVNDRNLRELPHPAQTRRQPVRVKDIYMML